MYWDAARTISVCPYPSGPGFGRPLTVGQRPLVHAPLVHAPLVHAPLGDSPRGRDR